MKKRAFYNEMYEEDGRVRPHYEAYARWLEATAVEHLLQKQREADALYTRLGFIERRTIWVLWRKPVAVQA